MSKPKVIVFGSNRPEHYSFTLNNKPIETVIQILRFTFILFWKLYQCKKHLVGLTNKAMHALCAKHYNLDLPIDIQLTLFYQTILPILTYNCESWGFENNDIIEGVHTNFSKKND
jgi:hypothetical protein